MLNRFEINGPSRILFGEGTIKELEKECRSLGGARPFLIMDSYFSQKDRISGILDSLGPLASQAGYFSAFDSEPSPAQAEAGARVADKAGADLIVGIGGGSALDMAKAIAVLVQQKGKVKDYIGLNRVPGPGLPTILMPTTAGTGSEVTFTSVFTDRKTGFKGGINSPYLYARSVILDPELTFSLPPFITATTGMDALTHAVEAYTSRAANPYSDLMAEEAIFLIGIYLRRAVFQGENREARTQMLLASYYGGKALAGAGVGAVHAMAYPLGAIFGIPHGLANAVLLPYVLRYNLAAEVEKFAGLAELLGEETEGISEREAAELAVDSITQLGKEIGIPFSLKDLKIPKTAIPELSKRAMTVTRPMENNPRRLTQKEVEALYHEAY